MSSKRTELIPYNDWFINPFFDKSVQRVLEPHRILKYLYGYDERSKIASLAWPICAVQLCTAAAEDIFKLKNDFAAAYQNDNIFISELFHIITLHVQLPRNEWSIRRALVDYIDQAYYHIPGQSKAIMDGNISINDIIRDPLTWKDIATVICREYPQHAAQMRSINAESRLRKEFNSEVKYRNQLAELWKPNIDAWKSRLDIMDEVLGNPEVSLCQY